MKEMTADDERLALQALSLLELFAFSRDDSEQRIVGMCQRAVTPLGQVAAVCVAPRFVCLARTTLDRLLAPGVRVVALVNFPYGGSSIEPVLSEVRAAVMSGADEIDVVYPFHALLYGDQQTGMDMITACKAACGNSVTLTVTLETGGLRDPQIILQACRSAILFGADFLKTSTGKGLASTTPQAVRIMLESIAEVGGQVGFKAAGGIRTFGDARVFMEMARSRFGPQWVNVDRVRLGASSLLGDLLARLGILESDARRP
ncbi:Deoxyribose-phosphate aldolase [Pseudomonas cichorii]|uniref:Deoxyribose-phosphate aldolase n=1 Tax=Pseudomonas cichorii TaxID=36746 RepID=A0A3M4LRS1_PSECI|nr:deoxyribose-phosphate aldolase [Pseudomonas cichorii]RMQ44197.1 Deoxyribose-phosphate aldolase [Pseudomonas cichorii]